MTNKTLCSTNNIVSTSYRQSLGRDFLHLKLFLSHLKPARGRAAASQSVAWVRFSRRVSYSIPVWRSASKG